MMIGETMFVTGIAMFLTAPISGRLSQILDPRVMMLIGFGGFAVGTYIASGITSDWDFNELLHPADPARLLADAVHGADQQSVARHAAAGAAEERVGPFQSDAKPRRRRRSRGDQHAAQPSSRSASGAPARERGLGAPRCRRSACSDAAEFLAGPSRRRHGGAEAARDAGAPASERDVVCRCLSGANRPVCDRRHFHAY